jgi:hypothetical protein
VTVRGAACFLLWVLTPKAGQRAFAVIQQQDSPSILDEIELQTKSQ